MCRRHNSYSGLARTRRWQDRQGLTLVELMVASTVMALLCLALGTLAMTVEQSDKAISGNGTAVQHARVVLDRMERTITSAVANEQFPGFAVFNTTVGTNNFPETLVVWAPTGAPADAAGLPRFNELVVFCPNPTQPQELWEITVPGDTRAVPALTNTSTWQTELAALKSGTSANKIVLTNLLRTAAASRTLAGVTASTTLAVVRFEGEKHPTATEWANYKANTLDWTDINWPLDRYGSTSGTANHWCRLELQLMPGKQSRAGDTLGQSAIPFFGSAVVQYQLPR